MGKRDGKMIERSYCRNRNTDASANNIIDRNEIEDALEVRCSTMPRIAVGHARRCMAFGIVRFLPEAQLPGPIGGSPRSLGYDKRTIQIRMLDLHCMSNRVYIDSLTRRSEGSSVADCFLSNLHRVNHLISQLAWQMSTKWAQIPGIEY